MLALAGTPGPVAAAEPQRFIGEVEAQFDAAHEQPKGPARLAVCTTLVSRAFDLATIAKATAARQWDDVVHGLSDDLVTAVSRRLAAECVSMTGHTRRGHAVIRRVRQMKDGVRITAQYPGPGGEAAGSVFVWSLVPGGPWGFRATDLSVDGHSAAITLREDFEGSLAGHHGDLAAAIADVARRAPR
jgi:hypothetical protein